MSGDEGDEIGEFIDGLAEALGITPHQAAEFVADCNDEWDQWDGETLNPPDPIEQYVSKFRQIPTVKELPDPTFDRDMLPAELPDWVDHLSHHVENMAIGVDMKDNKRLDPWLLQLMRTAVAVARAYEHLLLCQDPQTTVAALARRRHDFLTRQMETLNLNGDEP